MAAQRKKTVLKRKPVSFSARWRGYFFTGLVIVAPVVLTIYLIWTIITLVDAWVVPWVPAIYRPETYLGTGVPGFGVIIFLFFTAIVGWATRGIFGRQILRMWENLVERTPFVRSIYNAVKQISETVVNQSNTSFKQAALIEYPRKDLWAVAFVSTDTKGEVPEKLGGADLLSVFLPTTPNPTSGFLLFVPREDIVFLDMEIEDAAKLVISAGLVVPPTKAEIKAGRKPAPKPSSKASARSRSAA